MLKVQHVLDVARTGQPHQVSEDAALTIDDVVRWTSGTDWDGTLYQLTTKAALEIGAQFNARHGLGPMSLEGVNEPDVLIGELLELEAA